MNAIVSSVTKVYPRFQFNGYAGSVVQAQCYVKVHVSDKSVTALIGQLKNYRGTSVTNDYENIVPLVAAKILQDFDLSHLLPKRPWWQFWAAPKLTPHDVVGMAKWLEFYPPGAGLLPGGSLAVMQLEPEIEWHHCTKQAAVNHCEIPSAFLDINTDDLDLEVT